MCNPVPTAVDPALAAVLLNLGLSSAAQLLAAHARPGQQTANQGHPVHPPLPAPLGRPGRWLRAVARDPAGRVAQVLRKEGVRGTATLLREAAAKTVSNGRVPFRTWQSAMMTRICPS